MLASVQRPVACGTLFIKLSPTQWMQTMNQEQSPDQTLDQMPIMQKILDNPFLLLFIGVVFPTVFYIIWGVMELVTIPIAN
jgi:hypothetical protein